jgi:hypothetical protein
MMTVRRVVAMAAALTFTGLPALAGQAGAAAPIAETDVGDLVRALRDKPPPPPLDPDERPRRMFVIAPVIGSKPDTGVVFGGAGNIAAYHGDPKTTHISTSVFSATLSQRGQTLTSIRLTTFTRDDRWLIVGDNRFQWTSQTHSGSARPPPIQTPSTPSTTSSVSTRPRTGDYAPACSPEAGSS